MRNLLFWLAVALGVMTAPAYADWNRVGTLSLAPNFTQRVLPVQIGGVDRIRLRARGASVECLRVIVTFGNGNRRVIFQGRIRRGNPRRIDIPGLRGVRNLIFACRGRNGNYARLEVSVDLDRRYRQGGERDSYRDGYRDGYREGPRVGVEPIGPQGPNGRGGLGFAGQFYEVGVARFGPGRSRVIGVSGFRAPVDRIRLGVRRGAAFCGRVFVTFGNGRRQEVFEGQLVPGSPQIISFGAPRSVRNVLLNCRAIGSSGEAVILVSGRYADGQGRAGGYNGNGRYEDEPYRDDERFEDERFDDEGPYDDEPFDDEPFDEPQKQQD